MLRPIQVRVGPVTTVVQRHYPEGLKDIDSSSGNSRCTGSRILG